MQHIVNETITSLNFPRNISIEAETSDATIVVYHIQLQMVFSNILLNAIQDIGKEKGEIRIGFLEHIKNTIIEIENSGHSIPEEIIPHIFDSLATTKKLE